MRVLAIDIGSSSVKAGVLQHAGPPKRIARVPFKTTLKGDRAECDAEDILRAVRDAIAQLDVRKVDVIAHDAMGPSWLAIDARGKALTKVVTHQDRRSTREAQRIEEAIGRKRHLSIVGARPVPGGISSTTCLWHLQNAKPAMRKASLVGHLSTLLVNQLTGERVIDPSHASFTGLYHTTKLAGWHDELIDAVGVDRSLLPEVRESNEVAGTVTREAARRFGLQDGTPVLAGCLDGSAAMFATGAATGQLLNSAGTTDILALVIDKPRPDESLLTRGLGVEKCWLAVATISASGAALEWLRKAMFSEMPAKAFHAMASKRKPVESGLSFDASLAGSRTRVEPTTGSIAGLKLSTTREEILDALLASLARASAARIDTFARLGVPMKPRVITTGGGDRLAASLRREWPTRFKFESIDEAALRGLARLAETSQTR
jgi:xylulokinase